MVIVIIGPSGSGKDTQANFLVEKYGIPNISTGRIMRAEIAAGSELGKELDEIVSAGKWPSDELVYKVLLKGVKEQANEKGFLLNGYPRTENQIKLLDQLIEELGENLKAVIHFDLSEEEVLNRMAKQRKEGEDRPDMTDDAIKARYQSYKETIDPILEVYEKRGELINIDAEPSIEEIRDEVVRRLDSIS